MELTLTLMTLDEAHACIERIKGSLESVRAELFDLREREGWAALGYASFKDCIQDEFQMSEQRAYQLLNAFVVDRILAAPWQESRAFFGRDANPNPDSTMVESGAPVAPIPERHARELAVLLADEDAVREVVAEVREATGGKPTAAAYREAVNRHLDIIEPSERQAVVLQAIDAASPLLAEPETERALYALSRVKFWVYLDAASVAETTADPVQDAPAYAELAAWVVAIADAMQTRARGLRSVR